MSWSKWKAGYLIQSFKFSCSFPQTLPVVWPTDLQFRYCLWRTLPVLSVKCSILCVTKESSLAVSSLCTGLIDDSDSEILPSFRRFCSLPRHLSYEDLWRPFCVIWLLANLGVFHQLQKQMQSVQLLWPSSLSGWILPSPSSAMFRS